MRRLRGRDIAMTMQDALTALNPALTINEQIAEVLDAHDETLPAAGGARRRAIRDKAVEMMSSSASPRPRGGSATIRTSSPAACASAS
jgi:ABC-type dipeptide/oligopeptide/nickel transport system ATPase component